VNVRAGVILVAAGVLAACGSQVSPAAYYSAYGALPAIGTGSAANVPIAGSSAANQSSGSGTSVRTPTNVASNASNVPPAQPSQGAGGTTTAQHVGGSSHPTRSATATHAATSSSAAAPSCKAPSAAKPTVVVCPNTGLREGQTVKVYASGFPKSAFVVVIECADKGTATKQSDCGAIHTTRMTADGTLVGYEIQVSKTAGSNTCGATPCLISVTQASLNPKYEADQHISFG